MISKFTSGWWSCFKVPKHFRRVWWHRCLPWVCRLSTCCILPFPPSPTFTLQRFLSFSTKTSFRALSFPLCPPRCSFVMLMHVLLLYSIPLNLWNIHAVIYTYNLYKLLIWIIMLISIPVYYTGLNWTCEIFMSHNLIVWIISFALITGEGGFFWPMKSWVLNVFFEFHDRRKVDESCHFCVRRTIFAVMEDVHFNRYHLSVQNLSHVSCESKVAEIYLCSSFSWLLLIRVAGNCKRCEINVSLSGCYLESRHFFISECQIMMFYSTLIFIK